MPLPSSARVIFSKNTLRDVTAMIRFPAILRVQAEPPVAFQEKVRADFPIYSATNGSAMELPSDVPQEIQLAVQAQLQQSIGLPGQKLHRFVSADSNWQIEIAQDHMSFACRKYPKWEIFRDKLRGAFDHFVNEYRPAFALTTGLRYRNAIIRSQLGLKDVPWNELLSPFLLGELGGDGLAEAEIIASLHRFELSLGDTGKVLVQHGLASFKPTNERVYSIDNDFVTDKKVGLDDIPARLDEFNAYSGRLFRYCISERLFNAMGPSRQ
jgi:uncharacterized protein (TIGR04255 family)